MSIAFVISPLGEFLLASTWTLTNVCVMQLWRVRKKKDAYWPKNLLVEQRLFRLHHALEFMVRTSGIEQRMQTWPAFDPRPLLPLRSLGLLATPVSEASPVPQLILCRRSVCSGWWSSLGCLVPAGNARSDLASNTNCLALAFYIVFELQYSVRLKEEMLLNGWMDAGFGSGSQAIQWYSLPHFIRKARAEQI